MSRLTTAFDRLREHKRGGLVTYVTAGDPDLELTAVGAIELEGRRPREEEERPGQLGRRPVHGHAQLRPERDRPGGQRVGLAEDVADAERGG